MFKKLSKKIFQVLQMALRKYGTWTCPTRKWTFVIVNTRPSSRARWTNIINNFDKKSSQVYSANIYSFTYLLFSNLNIHSSFRILCYHPALESRAEYVISKKKKKFISKNAKLHARKIARKYKRIGKSIKGKFKCNALCL